METDWDKIVETNRQTLLRVLGAIIAMAGFAAGAQSTLPRHLYRAVLALMRPLESAIRRLIVVAARDVPVPVYPPKPAPVVNPSVVPQWSKRTGIVMVPIRSWGIANWGPPPKPKPERKPLSHYIIPICDPLWQFGKIRRKRVPEHLAPRISFFDGRDLPRPVAPPKPTRNDPMDASRLAMRLEAYARALADLPREARRMARWFGRRAAGYVKRLSPLRSGPAWASRGKRSKREQHEIDEALERVHGNAVWSADPKSREDTS